MVAANNPIMLGVHCDGSIAPQSVYLSPGHLGSAISSRNMVRGTNRAAVSAGAGNVYWRDTANNLVWVKIVPFTTNFWTGEVAGSDDDLYRSISLPIQECINKQIGLKAAMKVVSVGAGAAVLVAVIAATV